MPLRSVLAVEAVGLAMLARSARPITLSMEAGEVEVHSSLSGWFIDSQSVCLVQHRDSTTSSPDRLMAGALLHL